MPRNFQETFTTQFPGFHNFPVKGNISMGEGALGNGVKKKKGYLSTQSLFFILTSRETSSPTGRPTIPPLTRFFDVFSFHAFCGGDGVTTIPQFTLCVLSSRNGNSKQRSHWNEMKFIVLPNEKCKKITTHFASYQFSTYAQNQVFCNPFPYPLHTYGFQFTPFQLKLSLP